MTCRAWRSHRLGESGDLVDRLTLGAQGGQQRAVCDLGDGARHDRSEAHQPPRSRVKDVPRASRFSTSARLTSIAVAISVSNQRRRRLVGCDRSAEEISEQLFPDRGQDRFRMELDALDRQFAVAQAHDHAIRRLCRDLEGRRQGLPLHDQRVVPRRRERAGQSGEDAAAVVIDLETSCRACTIGARTTVAPKAAPIAWCPRHTPRIGTCSRKLLDERDEIPASAGVHGPGEMTIRSNSARRARISSTVILSLRTT